MHKLAAYREDKMGLTLAEKILKSHTVDGEFKKGCEIGLKIRPDSDAGRNGNYGVH